MSRRLGDALASSIGKKIVMGLTGLLLTGFLISHLAGNLKLVPGVGDTDGTAFDEYVAYLKSFGALLTVAELGLVALFGCHIYLAFRLTMENREARKQKYVIRSDRGAKTPGSATMFYSGALLLLFLIKHMLDFRFNADFHEAPAETAMAFMGSLSTAWVYLVGALLVGLHLSHGVQSAFQSLGFHHPSWTPILKIGGRVLAAVLALGFAWIPIYYLLLAEGGAG